jgi:signal transduction histidine kinase
LAKLDEPSGGSDLIDLRNGLVDWIERAKQTRRLFTHLLDEDNREIEARLRAKSLLRDILSQSRVLLRGVEIDIDSVDDRLRLPMGTFAEWSALFQNVLINACNAMIDTRQRNITISSRIKGAVSEIRVEDTGVGMDISKAESLFRPFERALRISPERRMLGMGGSGLGLTIVRMIAEGRGCRVGFVGPSAGFSTAFRLQWKEGRG